MKNQKHKLPVGALEMAQRLARFLKRLLQNLRKMEQKKRTMVWPGASRCVRDKMQGGRFGKHKNTARSSSVFTDCAKRQARGPSRAGPSWVPVAPRPVNSSLRFHFTLTP